MATVVLKDNLANEGTYTSIYHIKAPNSSGGVNVFTQMTGLKAYYATQHQDSAGNYMYTIAGMWFCVTGPGYAIADSNGEYLIIFTTAILSEGKTYYESELGGL